MNIEKEKYEQLTLLNAFKDNKYWINFKLTIEDGVICICVERPARAGQARAFTPPKEA